MRYFLAIIITAAICGLDWGFVCLAERLNEAHQRSGMLLSKWEGFIVGAGGLAAENFVWTCVVVFLLVASVLVFYSRDREPRDDESESEKE